MKLISVVVPVYNTEKYVTKCIESILNQTYLNFELIVINDGSTDQSYTLCKAYTTLDRRVIVLSKKNEGVSIARNIGIEHARGDFITFIDSDDYVSENYLEILLSTLMNNDSDLAICNYDRFYDNGRFITSGFNYEDASYDIQDVKKLFIYNESKFVLTAVVRLYSLDLIKNEMIRFHEDMSYGEDYIFQIEYALKCHQVSFLSSNILYHRAEDNPYSLSRSKIELCWETHSKINRMLYKVIAGNSDVKYEAMLNCLGRFTQVYLRFIIEAHNFKEFSRNIKGFFSVQDIDQVVKDIQVTILDDPRLKYLNSLSSSSVALLIYYFIIKIYFSIRFFLKKIYIERSFIHWFVRK